MPLSEIRPLWGSRSAIARSNRLLPLPEGPDTQTTCPPGTASDTLANAPTLTFSSRRAVKIESPGQFQANATIGTGNRNPFGFRHNTSFLFGFHWEQRTGFTKTCLPTAIGKALLNL